MPKKNLSDVLKKEVDRIDSVKTTKRNELVIEGFVHEKGRAPVALVHGKKHAVFNSNDYLGLRHHPQVKEAEHAASQKYGTGPGAVRFISGTMDIHRALEKELASFHGKEDAMIFSSSFAVNLAVLHCFIKGQSKDSLVESNTLVISDALNHRSIIDGIRVAGLSKEHKAIFKHLDLDDLRRVLDENKGKFSRVLVVTDGVFSMLGEYQDLKKMQSVCDEFADDYEEGVLTFVDDAHGVAGFGKTGRGTEEHCSAKVDILIATMGKGFGADGGYVAGDKVYIDYLRESAATYIYSNPISPGTAGAALSSVKIMGSSEGKALLDQLNNNIVYFKEAMKNNGFTFAADSEHGIQPILIGDPVKTRELVDELFSEGIIVTNISYPVVPKGKDEIRVQISAAHTHIDLEECIEKFKVCGKKVGVI